MQVSPYLETTHSDAHCDARKALYSGTSFMVLLKDGDEIVPDESVPLGISRKTLVEDIADGQHEHAVMVVRILGGYCKDISKAIAQEVLDHLISTGEIHDRTLPDFVFMHTRDGLAQVEELKAEAS